MESIQLRQLGQVQEVERMLRNEGTLNQIKLAQSEEGVKNQEFIRRTNNDIRVRNYGRNLQLMYTNPTHLGLNSILH